MWHWVDDPAVLAFILGDKEALEDDDEPPQATTDLEAADPAAPLV